MADLVAIQTTIMPRLERLLALAAGWAEPLAPGLEPAHGAIPGTSADRTALGSTDGSSAVSSGVAWADASASAATGIASAPPDLSAGQATAIAAMTVEPRAPHAVHRDAAPRRAAPSATHPFRDHHGVTPSDVPATPPPMSLPVIPVARASLRRNRQEPTQPDPVGAPRSVDPPVGDRRSGGTRALLPRFRLARRAPAEPARPPAFGLAGAGVAPPDAGSESEPAPFAPPPVSRGLAAGPAGTALPLSRTAPPSGAGSLPLPSVTAPALSAAPVAPALTDDALEDALADLLERAALEAGVALP
jgi:hypothetical protein